MYVSPCQPRRPFRLLVASFVVITLWAGLVTGLSSAATEVVAPPLRADASPETEYEVFFDAIAHHEAHITATFRDVPVRGNLRITMSRSSPGRYALHEFAKNVYDIRAMDDTGRPLGVERTDPFNWEIETRGGDVTLAYTLFADRADGTYSGFDRTQAHMNMPATFMWAPDMWDAPVSVRFHRPDPSWDIATQLFETDHPDLFTAPDMAYFMDSPTVIAPMTWYEWDVEEQDGAQAIRIALRHTGTDEEGAAFARSVERIVRAQHKVFGEMPRYDTGRYTFIVGYTPYVHGDGMEHRNSTVVTSTNPLSPDGLSNLGTMSHEFFHQWNVERIRPRDLEPFAFTSTNQTDLLWFSEGFTSYYTDLSIHRAGLSDISDYASGLASRINTVLDSPGRMHRSVADMSRWAAFSDQGSFRDPMNTANTFISYYTWGSALGLGLDMVLRSEYDTSVDALMRHLWDEYGREEDPITSADLEEAVAHVSGSKTFAQTFFDRYVTGNDAMDYGALLARAGFLLRPVAPDSWTLGGQLAEGEGGIEVRGRVLEGSPLHAAGLSTGDVITKIDGRHVSHPAYVDALLDSWVGGRALQLDVYSRGVHFSTLLTPARRTDREVVLYENAGMNVTPEMESLRAAWLWGTGTEH